MMRAANLLVLRDRGDDPDALFRTIYGLPVELQLALAAATLARTLPIIEQHAAGLEASAWRVAARTLMTRSITWCRIQ